VVSRKTSPVKCPMQGLETDTRRGVNELLIGYARVSNDGQDLTAQREALLTLGVSPEPVRSDLAVATAG